MNFCPLYSANNSTLNSGERSRGRELGGRGKARPAKGKGEGGRGNARPGKVHEGTERRRHKGRGDASQKVGSSAILQKPKAKSDTNTHVGLIKTNNALVSPSKHLHQYTHKPSPNTCAVLQTKKKFLNTI